MEVHAIDHRQVTVPASLGARTTRGAVLSTIRVIGPTICAAVGTVVLSHLLAPGDFGRYVVALGLATIGYHLVANGIIVRLICLTEVPSARLLRGVFVGAAASTSCVAVVVVVVAGALLAGTDRLLAMGVALYLATSALRIVPTIKLYRDLRFGRLAMVETAEQATIQCAAIVVAMAGLPGSALAVGLIAGAFVGSLAFWLAAPWTPIGGWDMRGAWKEWSRSGSLQLSSIFGTARESATLPVLALALTATQIGLFGWSASVVAVVLALSGALGQSLLPALVHIRHDQVALRETVRLAQRLVAVFVMITSGCVAGLVPSILSVLYGDDWQPAARPAQVMIVMGVLMGLVQVPIVAALAVGRARHVAVAQGASLGAYWLVGVVLASSIGIWGAVIGFGAAATVSWSLLTVQMRDSIPVRRCGGLLLAAIASSLALAIAVNAIATPDRGLWGLLTGGLVCLGISAAIFMPRSPFRNDVLTAVGLVRQREAAPRVISA